MTPMVHTGIAQKQKKLGLVQAHTITYVLAIENMAKRERVSRKQKHQSQSRINHTHPYNQR